jgi:hypothetical protein
MPSKRGHLVAAALCYALWIVYSSLVLRPDWIANLLLLIPLGYLLMASLRFRRLPWGGSGAIAFLIGFTFILSVKYAQLFFPPRTVTLNYVTSQTIGLAFGINLSGLISTRFVPRIAERFKDGTGLIILLGGYTLFLITYFLMPLDIALDRIDLEARFRQIPETILSFPGAGAGIGFRVLVVLGDALSMAPVGMLLAALYRSLSLRGQLLRGLLLVLFIEFMTLFVLSANPYAVAIVYRMVGIWLGLLFMRLIYRMDLRKWHYIAYRYVPLTMLLYALVLIFANGIVSRQWVGLDQAINSLEVRQMLPFWNFYIVTKVRATQSLVVHIALFAPIGIMIWVRQGLWRDGARFSAFLAFLLSLMIEVGRWLKPGLRPDFTDPIIAAAAAAVAFRAMPTVWRLLERETMIKAAADRARMQRSSADPASVHRSTASPDEAPIVPAAGARPINLIAPGAGERLALRPKIAALVIATLCVLATGLFFWRYPLPIWFLAGALSIYAAALWRWSGLWLVVVPAVIASFSLTPWTGWTMVGESDLFVLITIAILAIRDPPLVADLLPKGPARAIVFFCGFSMLLACVIGLESRYGAHGTSSLAYMRPDNALSAVKGFAIALVLMPFLRHRERVSGDAIRLLALGILVGLSIVAAETFVERALFSGAFDILELYPASGPFASMNVGGGHLGVYVAAALPFALLRRNRTRRLERFAMRLLDVAAIYVVFFSFSIIVYVAAAIAAILTFLGRPAPSVEARARRHKKRGFGHKLLQAVYGLALIVVVAATLVIYSAFSTQIGAGAASIVHSEEAVARRLNLGDDSITSAIFGMGLGSFPRVAARVGDGRSDFSVVTEDRQAFLRLTTGDSFYLGQKVAVGADAKYELTVSVRSPDGKSYARALICEKLVLYSRNCIGHDLRPTTAGEWQNITVEFFTAARDSSAGFGPFRMPVDLAFQASPRDDEIDIRDVRLIGPDGRQLVANGDFTDGIDRWYFSDEDHDRWQIMNQYLMILFESGLTGLAAFLTLVGAAIIGARRAMRRGEKVGAAIVASLGAFLFLCLFEPPLQSAAISATFHLICFSGLLMLERGTYRAYLARPRLARAILAPAQPRPSQMRDGAVVSTASTARTPSASRAASGVRPNTSS